MPSKIAINSGSGIRRKIVLESELMLNEIINTVYVIEIPFVCVTINATYEDSVQIAIDLRLDKRGVFGKLN